MATPELTPYTTPPDVTVATAVLPEDQVPPVVASVRVMVFATQTLTEPAMPAGATGPIVTVFVADTVPQVLDNE